MCMGMSEMVNFSNFQMGGVVVHECEHHLGAERVALEWLGESRICMGKPDMMKF